MSRPGPVHPEPGVPRSREWAAPRAAPPSRPRPGPPRARAPPPLPQPPPPAPAPQHKLSVPLAPSSAPGASRSSPAHSAHSGRPPPHDPPSPARLPQPLSGPAERPGRSAPPSSDQVSPADAGRRPCWREGVGWSVCMGGSREGPDPRAIVQPEREPQMWVPGSLGGKGGDELSGKPRLPTVRLPPHPSAPRPGRVDRGRLGKPDDRVPPVPCPGATVPRQGCGLWGHRAGRGLAARSSHPGRPVPVSAALWTPGARRAPAPRRPRARLPAPRPVPARSVPRRRWVAGGCLKVKLGALGVCPSESQGLGFPPASAACLRVGFQGA